MRKLFILAICIALCIAMAVPAFAESKAKVPADDLTVIFEDDFSDDGIDTDSWSLREGVAIVDGAMSFCNAGGWVTGGYSATIINGGEALENYVLDFDFTSTPQDCYFGVGVRASAGGASEFQNGGRFNVPQAVELGSGISFDLAISKNQNPDAVGYVGVALNNGGAWGDAEQFLVAYPDGFDGSNGHVTIVDTGDVISLFINKVEVVTLTLDGSNVKAYNANGDEIFTTSAADYPTEGTAAFYQRNNPYKVDNVKVSEFKESTGGEDTPATYTLHGASFDTIFVNDVMNFGQGDGAASDKLDGVNRTVDGSDGSVQTIRLRGWIGFESEIDQLGYQINGKNTFGDYKVTPEAAVVDPANGGRYATRFDMTIDVSELKGTNAIVAVAKLADGTVVKIDENITANGAGTTPNTSFTYIGPADENAQTGDMTVAMFAVIAVLALGAAVVFAKKRSF